MTKNNVLSRLRDELAQLQAYHVADAGGFIKLDAMENPYGWPQDLRAQWLEELRTAELNRYPEPDPEKLKQQLGKQFDAGQQHATILGNGSDELIQLITLAIAKPGASILTVSPSFSMYELIAKMIGVDCHVVPLDDEFNLPLEDMLTAIDQYDPALIFLAYPNNPTGNLWNKQDIIKIIEASKGFVMVDEAYGPFTDETFSSELQHYSNLLLLRTASKLGLAGTRFGWLTGQADVIAELNKLRLPYNINLLTQLTLTFALDHFDVFAEQAQMIRASRATLFNELQTIDGLKVYSSEANFILFKTLQTDASDVFEQLKQQKVLIKNLSAQQGLKNCLRVTVGSEEENQAFLSSLKKASA